MREALCENIAQRVLERVHMGRFAIHVDALGALTDHGRMTFGDTLRTFMMDRGLISDEFHFRVHGREVIKWTIDGL